MGTLTTSFNSIDLHIDLLRGEHARQQQEENSKANTPPRIDHDGEEHGQLGADAAGDLEGPVVEGEEGACRGGDVGRRDWQRPEGADGGEG